MFAFATVLLIAISALSANAGHISYTLEDIEAAEKCFKDIGITSEIVEATWKNGLKDADEKFKCYAACVLKQKHEIKDDGSLDIEKLIKDIPDQIKGDERDAIAKAIEKCGQKKEANECETVFNAIQCAVQDMSKLKIYRK